jgi:hypothetical protein
VSVEADRAWIEKVESWLRRLGPNEAGGVRLLHLGYDEGTGSFRAEEIAAAQRGPVDVLVVDAPPDRNGTLVRLRLCLELLPILSDRGTLLLHDTNRTDERYAYGVLRTHFALSELHDTVKGIAVLRYPRSATP